MGATNNTSPTSSSDDPVKHSTETPSASMSSGDASYRGYDHMTWYVSNAKQAASYFITRMGFKSIAYRGLETGSKVVASHVVSNNAARFVFTSALRPSGQADDQMSEANEQLLKRIHDHVAKHGDAVSDIAFEVDNAEAMYNSAISKGAAGVQGPTTVYDGDDKVVLAVIKTFGDVTHTLVERSQYGGVFLPGYVPTAAQDPVNDYLPKVEFEAIDHCVGNQDWHEMQATSEYYEKCLGFNRHWSPDDYSKSTEYSSMNSIVMSAPPNGVVKIPINEPAHGRNKSQIEEFVKYNGGAGVQHIAFRTPDIVDCVTNMKRRGVQFITVPGVYYEELRKRLSSSDIKVEEDLDMIERLSILVDFDEGGYLLQLFTKHLTDRPTVFIEIIQRNNFDGFGAGNFRALFQAIEREQAKRGEL